MAGKRLDRLTDTDLRWLARAERAAGRWTNVDLLKLEAERRGFILPT